MFDFSTSHDYRSIRIYSHCLVIDRPNTTFNRHPIHKFDFTVLDSKEKWIVYKFNINVDNIKIPTHFKRICLVIDKLPPNTNFEISELQFSEASRLL
jgi:hypothetical protein